MSDQQRLIPLSDAAFRLRISYHRAWRRLLAGELKGEKRAGKWFVLAGQLPEREGRDDDRPTVDHETSAERVAL